jgi:hypothetical protein
LRLDGASAVFGDLQAGMPGRSIALASAAWPTSAVFERLTMYSETLKYRDSAAALRDWRAKSAVGANHVASHGGDHNAGSAEFSPGTPPVPGQQPNPQPDPPPPPEEEGFAEPPIGDEHEEKRPGRTIGRRAWRRSRSAFTAGQTVARALPSRTVHP